MVGKVGTKAAPAPAPAPLGPDCVVVPVGGYSARRWCRTHGTYVDGAHHSPK